MRQTCFSQSRCVVLLLCFSVVSHVRAAEMILKFLKSRRNSAIVLVQFYFTCKSRISRKSDALTTRLRTTAVLKKLGLTTLKTKKDGE